MLARKAFLPDFAHLAMPVVPYGLPARYVSRILKTYAPEEKKAYCDSYLTWHVLVFIPIRGLFHGYQQHDARVARHIHHRWQAIIADITPLKVFIQQCAHE